ncbi:threonine ammonia-lyase [Cohaesibacter intestini]|uniref:threonine ammonia-lyase n=1 Tax=Cohaesibacter intestini TaxID=2211145 RepID=UPI000DEB0473|nr:threonine/serine dehydratase [Cohaesibacter intestini]
MTTKLAVSIDDIHQAAKRLLGHAVRTPLLEFEALNARVGKRVLVKFEGVQRTGSFKFRGAYNRLSALDPADRAKGVIAWSSGNHAQGVAAAAKQLGMPATIVMPADAPAIKMNNTKGFGAKVVTYDRYTESREEIALALAKETGAVVVPSYNDPFIIAGQGTVGLEMVEQARAANASIGAVLACCGGGGLSSGIATAIKAYHPDACVYSVEPAGFDSMARSLSSDQPQGNADNARSICDALQSPYPGEMTLAINKQLLAGGLAVSDEEVKEAMRFAFTDMKLVTEPGGAAALTAAYFGKVPDFDGDLVLVISGANVDPELFCQILSGA